MTTNAESASTKPRPRNYLYTYGNNDCDQGETARQFSIARWTDEFYIVNREFFGTWVVGSPDCPDSQGWKFSGYPTSLTQGNQILVPRTKIESQGHHYSSELREIFYLDLPDYWQAITSGRIRTGVGFVWGPHDGKLVTYRHAKSSVHALPVGNGREAIYALTARGRFRFLTTQAAGTKQNAAAWDAAADDDDQEGVPWE